MDENLLLGAALDRAYRLAMLAAGSPRAAARLLRRACAARTDAPVGRLDTPQPGRLDAPPWPLDKAAIARGLLGARPVVWPWRPDPRAKSGLTPGEVATLRAALAAAAPAARLALGAPHLADIDLDETPPRSVTPDAPWPRRATDRHALLALLARAWGMLPEGAPYADVHEQTLLLAGALPPDEAAALRAHLLDATPAATQARAIRDGLRRAEARLAAALPALFAGEAPAELRAALERPARPARVPQFIARRRLALVAAVAALALLVIALPRPAPGTRPLADPAPQPALPPEALVRAAHTRLAAPEGAGVLHERFAASSPGYGWTLERWQELAPPHRFRIEVRDDDERLRFALASDGARTIQQRATPRDGTALTGEDYELPPEALASLLPVLRQQPDGLALLAQWNGGFDLERFYLGQALGAPLRDMGATVAAGRPARTLAFQSTTPTPPSPDEPLAIARGGPAQVLLTIDAATYALLEARVLPGGAAPTGEVNVPWRAEVYELIDAAPEGTFTLPPVALPSSPQGM